MNTIHKLTEDEALILGAILSSPAYSTLKKIAETEIKMLQNLMVNENDEKTIYRLQGRITGIRSFIMVPEAVVMEHRVRFDKEKKNKSKEKP